ncbi:hypothetical protein AGABI1DRAFT_115898 [Agaricus bisporus var. burnettii JB137-S8]|uniref:Uncharacterized protein n=1 Tax=Agaricus bisporus var. burnettii (strain JB137-S8 / ATCC MYA-4627 / FGSC 10392) TaxID=597362 RepID=K5WM02_AGABU|nr:uncharacterized protein AGABI1DRAFT_115898 [Agaricus bisporus var. burnettii JB137-S8]EKM76346.1 hypothetical protein AGABI1DRAFT_115898 [Agaricus bisporus var. burnettii JB137-S8]
MATSLPSSTLHPVLPLRTLVIATPDFSSLLLETPLLPRVIDMPSAPSLHLKSARRTLATRMNQPLEHQLSDTSVLAGVSMTSNESSDQHQQTPSTSAAVSSQAAILDPSIPSPQQPPISSSTTPSSSINSIPTPPPYLESQRLMDSILAVSCIVMYSYILAFDRVYGGPQSDIQFYHYTPTPPKSLLHKLLLGRRTGLVSAEEFMQYGITFPSITYSADSEKSIPPRFQYPVLRYPRVSRIPVIYPMNAPSIMHQRTDWDAQVQQFLDYYRPYVFEPTPTAQVSPAIDEQPRHQHRMPVFPIRRPKRYSRNARAIKPLPKRAQAVAPPAQPTVLEFVTQTVADVGSVIVRGVKRLKDGLEDGGIIKKRRLF